MDTTTKVKFQERNKLKFQQKSLFELKPAALKCYFLNNLIKQCFENIKLGLN